MRHENPHSLSYQEIILTILLSRTFVDNPSIGDDADHPRKSIETSGSSV